MTTEIQMSKGQNYLEIRVWKLRFNNMSKTKTSLIFVLTVSILCSPVVLPQTGLQLSQEVLASDGSFIPADSVYYEYAAGSNCNPGQWCAGIDWRSGNQDFEGEMTFDISSLSGETLDAAEVCAYRVNWPTPQEVVTNYIEKIDSSTCNNAPSISAPGILASRKTPRV